ncbi:MAG: hypothetical protein LBM69_02240, partial [Lachnospiraceae bacterium]|nr:hypothetical protein [Lachnospiraceae bacterium]
MPIRITGMNSGLDTEAIVKGLVEARQIKVDSTKKEQTKLEWKQDAWKTLNSKFYGFYTSTLTGMTYKSSYMKKSTSVSDSNIASVLTSNTAMNAQQNMVVSKLAKTGYLTGEKIAAADGKPIASAATKLADLGIAAGSSFDVTIGSGASAKTTSIAIEADTTIEDVVNRFKEIGLSANFDTKNSRFYLSAQGSGAAKDFTISANSVNGVESIEALGLTTNYDQYLDIYRQFDDFTTNTVAKDAYIENESYQRAQAAKALSDTLAGSIAD